MAKTPEQRGPIGAWLVEQRRARGWDSAALARAGLERAGVMRVAQSVYAEWEAGTKRPNAEQMEALTRFYGSVPERRDTSGDVAAAIRAQAESNDRIAAAMERQAEAFTLLTASIDRASAGVIGRVEGFDELLHGLLVALAGPAPEAQGEGRPVGPRGRAGLA